MKIWEAIGETIGAFYYWYWHDFLCRREPFTHEFRRRLKLQWWVVLVIVVHTIVPAFDCWLLLHLGKFC